MARNGTRTGYAMACPMHGSAAFLLRRHLISPRHPLLPVPPCPSRQARSFCDPTPSSPRPPLSTSHDGSTLIDRPLPRSYLNQFPNTWEAAESLVLNKESKKAEQEEGKISIQVLLRRIPPRTCEDHA